MLHSEIQLSTHRPVHGLHVYSASPCLFCFENTHFTEKPILCEGAFRRYARNRCARYRLAIPLESTRHIRLAKNSLQL